MTRTAESSVDGRCNLQPFFRAFAVTILLVAFSVISMANPQATGVRNSAGPRRLSEQQLQGLRDSLRQKTGLVELAFDAQGLLTLGDQKAVAGGSEAARALLVAAVGSPDLYELESHERSPEIAFARIRESADRVAKSSSVRTTIHVLAFDFYDFRQIEGSREAKASFDIGFAFLHELAHGVLNLKDPPGGTNQIGECDAHINQMRRELQVPERVHYHPGVTVVQLAGSRMIHARLEFVKRTEPNSNPTAEYSLTWLPRKVSPKARNVAGLQQGLLGTGRR